MSEDQEPAPLPPEENAAAAATPHDSRTYFVRTTGKNYLVHGVADLELMDGGALTLIDAVGRIVGCFAPGAWQSAWAVTSPADEVSCPQQGQSPLPD